MYKNVSSQLKQKGLIPALVGMTAPKLLKGLCKYYNTPLKQKFQLLSMGIKQGCG
jgi:hypothetical protein